MQVGLVAPVVGLVFAAPRVQANPTLDFRGGRGRRDADRVASTASATAAQPLIAEARVDHGLAPEIDDQPSRLTGALRRSRRPTPAPALSSLGQRGSRGGVTRIGVKQQPKLAADPGGRRPRTLACSLPDTGFSLVAEGAVLAWLLLRCPGRPKEKPRTTHLRPMTRLVVRESRSLRARIAGVLPPCSCGEYQVSDHPPPEPCSAVYAAQPGWQERSRIVSLTTLSRGSNSLGRFSSSRHSAIPSQVDDLPAYIEALAGSTLTAPLPDRPSPSRQQRTNRRAAVTS
jgi:hypothetical protein